MLSDWGWLCTALQWGAYPLATADKHTGQVVLGCLTTLLQTHKHTGLCGLAEVRGKLMCRVFGGNCRRCPKPTLDV